MNTEHMEVAPLGLYTPRETARILRIGRGEVMELIRRRELRAWRRTGRGWWRIPGESIQAYVQGMSVEPDSCAPRALRRRCPVGPSVDEIRAQLRAEGKI